MQSSQNQTIPNWITLNWTMLSQSKVFTTKSSCENKKRGQLKLKDTVFFWTLLPYF